MNALVPSQRPAVPGLLLEQMSTILPGEVMRLVAMAEDGGTGLEMARRDARTNLTVEMRGAIGDMLRELDRCLAPIDYAGLYEWLEPVARAFGHREDPDTGINADLAARIDGLLCLLPELPTICFTPEARRELRCTSFPTAEHIRRAVSPGAGALRIRRNALRMLLAVRPEIRRPDEALTGREVERRVRDLERDASAVSGVAARALLGRVRRERIEGVTPGQLRRFEERLEALAAPEGRRRREEAQERGSDMRGVDAATRQLRAIQYGERARPGAAPAWEPKPNRWHDAARAARKPLAPLREEPLDGEAGGLH